MLAQALLFKAKQVLKGSKKDKQKATLLDEGSLFAFRLFWYLALAYLAPVGYTTSVWLSSEIWPKVEAVPSEVVA